MAEERISKKPHNIIMENRKKLSISGVNDVGSFDDETVIAYTDMGTITIKGTNLHIGKLSTDTGELTITGEIGLMAYSDAATKKAAGVFAKMFR